MFGVSFTELMFIGVVALVVVGPQRLPGMMSTVGKWANKLRRMLFDVRQQSGIDDILRAEGITGGLNEIRALRNAVRGNVSSLTQALTAGPRVVPPVSPSPPPTVTPPAPSPAAPLPGADTDPYADVPYDRTREYPDEGCDAYGAIPDDLWSMSRRPVPPAVPIPDEPPPPPAPHTSASATPIDEPAAAGAELETSPTSTTSEPPSETRSAETHNAEGPAAEGPGVEAPGAERRDPAHDGAPPSNEPSVVPADSETTERALPHGASSASHESPSESPVASKPEPEANHDSTVKANAS